METRKLRVAMEEVLEAMTPLREDPFHYFLDLEEGGVLSAPWECSDLFAEDTQAKAIEANPERYEPIPRFDGPSEYDLMCHFSEDVSLRDIQAKLDLALRGKGAFGRFRSVLRAYPDLEQQWRIRRR